MAVDKEEYVKKFFEKYNLKIKFIKNNMYRNITGIKNLNYVMINKQLVTLEQGTAEYVPIDIKNFNFEVCEKLTEEPFSIERFCEESDKDQIPYKNHTLGVSEDGELLLINGAGATTWLDSSKYYFRLKR